MNQLMTKEESYVERRKLFKTIWDTAMQINEKDAENIMKPKVIKTLKLDEVDRCVNGKKKKQRLKNLRTVCNKILDFCDREDADDLFYEHMAAEGKQPPQDKEELNQKKKMIRRRRKIKKAMSLFSSPNNSAKPKSTTSEKKDQFHKDYIGKISRNTSPTKTKRTTLVKRSRVVRNKLTKSDTSPKKLTVPLTIHFTGDTTVARHKVVKKIITKRKKHQVNNTVARGT